MKKLFAFSILSSSIFLSTTPLKAEWDHWAVKYFNISDTRGFGIYTVESDTGSATLRSTKCFVDPGINECESVIGNGSYLDSTTGKLFIENQSGEFHSYNLSSDTWTDEGSAWTSNYLQNGTFERPSVVGSGLTVTDGGLNYTASPNNGTSPIETFAITGGGTGLKLSIASVGVGGSIIEFNETFREGSGYKVGDVVGIVTSSVGTSGGQGRGARLTITNTQGIDKIFLTNVKGDNNSFAGNVGTALSFFNDSNNIVSFSNCLGISLCTTSGSNSCDS